jgi:xylulokinase
MPIVAGFHSSARSTTLTVRDADTGAPLPDRPDNRAPHPGAPEPDRHISEIDPDAWLHSLGAAAGGNRLQGVQAIGVAAQSQGLVALDTADADQAPVRPALLRGDRRVAACAVDLRDEAGGAEAWTHAVGAPPSATGVLAKLRWMARQEPELARRTGLVLQPHDWLVWQLLGRPERPTTDRGDASGTGYWSPVDSAYRPELLARALGRDPSDPSGLPRVPDVLPPGGAAGTSPEGLLISAGTGSAMALALGLGLVPGDAVVTLGASGTVHAQHREALPDPTGQISSYADATGRHLPTVGTLNAAHVLRATAQLLDTDAEGLSELALRSTPGARGLVLLPYLRGERTPALPHAAGTLSGLREESMAPEHLARAAVEGMVCGLADGLDLLRERGVTVRRVFLLGQVGRLAAVREIAAQVFGTPVVVPPTGDWAARGAARQAAWALAGSADPPVWPVESCLSTDPGGDAAVGTAIRGQFAATRDALHPRGA